jgi:hypothetical protein
MEVFQKKSILISTLTISFFSGCTQEALYETFRHSDKYNCHDIVNPQEKIECFQSPRKSYKEYKQYLEQKSDF